MAKPPIKGRGEDIYFNGLKEEGKKTPSKKPVKKTERIKRTYYLQEDVIADLEKEYHLRKIANPTETIDRSDIVTEALRKYFKRSKWLKHSDV